MVRKRFNLELQLLCSSFFWGDAANTVKLFNLGAVASCALLVGKKAGVTVLAQGGGQKIFLAQFGKKQILLIMSTVHACMHASFSG